MRFYIDENITSIEHILSLLDNTTSINISLGNNIIDTMNSILDFIIQFEELYGRLKDSYESTIYIKEIHIPFEELSPQKFKNSINKKIIKETYYENEINNFLSSALGFDTTPRSITESVQDYQLFGPLIFPRVIHENMFDYGIILPNFSKRFYALGKENLNFHSFNNLQSYQRLIADYILTIIIKNLTSPESMFGLYILSKIYQTPRTIIINDFLKNIKTDQINLEGIETLKSGNLDSIYDKLDTIKNTASLIQILSSNITSSFLDFYKDEILFIIIGQSDYKGPIMEYLNKLLFNPFKYALEFINKNNLPRALLFHSGSRKISYTVRGKETLVLETRIDIGGSPIKKNITTTEYTKLTEELIKSFSSQLLTRRIKIINGRPLIVTVTTDGDKIHYESNIRNLDLENIHTINLPVSNWDDAIRISGTLELNSKIVSKRTYKKCKIKDLGSVISSIQNLVDNAETFNIILNPKNKIIEFNIETVEAQ